MEEKKGMKEVEAQGYKRVKPRASCIKEGGAEGGGGPVNQPASCQHLPPAPPRDF